jgi:mannose-6-phosphate isomerase-like protein (cupin superfamily)
MKEKSLDSPTKGKIETVVIRIKGDDYDLAKREIDFIRNNIRGISQYLEVKKFITEEISEAKINLFNLEADLNEQLLNIERTESQLLSYQSIQKESNEVKDMQIILNLSNEEVTAGDKKELNNISEFSGAKYLPLSNRIVALKSEMADQMEAVQISELQIEALKLSQNVLDDLVVVRGKATIIKDGKQIMLNHDQSTYIKMCIKHQLINQEKESLEIIEVQTGKKVIEEDIVRYKDNYGRV